MALAGGGPAAPRRAFLLGLTTGGIYFGGTIYWVVGVMSTYGGLSPALAALAGALLVAYLAFYPALAALLTQQAIARLGVGGVWLAPAYWVAAEWLRATVGGGFPWVLLGTSQSPVVPVAQTASLVGVYGLSLLVALTGAAAAAVALSRRPAHLVRAAAVAGLVAGLAVWGAWRVASGRLIAGGAVLRVGLVQGNVGQDVKWDPAHREAILERYLDLSRQVLAAGAGLVVWPEASTPFFFEEEPEAAARVRRLARETATPFLIGTDELEAAPGEAQPRLFNSALIVGADGRTRGAYRKVRLVPFGEYVPLKRLLFFIGPLVEAVSDFSPGAEPVVLDGGGVRVGAAICYESVYPWLARAFVARGSQLLATITNDAWFGRSSAAYQHFDQGALRAVETGRYLVRAANTGISGVVDPYGRVLLRTPLFEPAAATAEVRLLDRRTVYGRTGDVVVWGSLVIAGAGVWSGWRGRRARANGEAA